MMNQFFHSLGNLPLITDAVSRSLSAENPTGEPGKGATAETGVNEWARDLGKGWKLRPYIDIQPGETVTIADVDGPGVIQSMWFANASARQLILRIYWDGQEQPSVECPLMEFFAYSWYRHGGKNTQGPFFQLSSIPVAVNPNRGFNCYWPMPFRKKCRMTVENRTDMVFACYYQINYTLTGLPDNTGYFHAHFRCTKMLPYKENYTIIDGIEGEGQYVGTALFVGLNGSGDWWGEGEIKFYMDGDNEYPTICGTGTEDYFGGAYDWVVDGEYTLYTTPYLGVHQLVQPDDLFQSQRRFSMYRWHIMDPIRFKKRLRVTIQDLGLNRPEKKFLVRRDDMASVAYWYQNLPAKPFAPFSADEDIMFI